MYSHPTIMRDRKNQSSKLLGIYADYKKKDIVGANFVESKGGLVVIIPYLEGQSTTKLIKKIKGRSFKKVHPKHRKEAYHEES